MCYHFLLRNPRPPRYTRTDPVFPCTTRFLCPSSQLRECTEHSILQWIRSHGHALAATDPTPDDRRSLATALGSPRVIGIGEITHGTHEDLAVKSALIRALIERGDIDCLVFELNRRVGERLQR